MNTLDEIFITKIGLTSKSKDLENVVFHHFHFAPSADLVKHFDSQELGTYPPNPSGKIAADSDHNFMWIALFWCTVPYFLTGSDTLVTYANFLTFSFVVCRIILRQRKVHAHTHKSMWIFSKMPTPNPSFYFKLWPILILIYAELPMQLTKTNLIFKFSYLTFHKESCLIIKHKTSLFLYIWW